jgi:lipocalin
MLLRFVVCCGLIAGFAAAAADCPLPSPAVNFSRAGFSGTWREIGKYQTFNPFESGCNCTMIQVDPALPKINDICVKNGAVSNVSADLNPVENAPAGVFDEVFHFGPVASSTRLTIVDIGTVGSDEYAVEFDCAVQLHVSRSYCFHVFTRSGTASLALVNKVQQLAASLGLNPQNLAWQPTYQGAGCP